MIRMQKRIVRSIILIIMPLLMQNCISPPSPELGDFVKSPLKSPPVTDTPQPSVNNPIFDAIASAQPSAPVQTSPPRPVLLPTVLPSFEPLPIPEPSQPAKVKITINHEQLIAETSEKYLSFAVDATHIVNTNNELNFNAPNLNKYTRALAPAYLSIGGTAADKIYYDMENIYGVNAPGRYEYTLSSDQWDNVNNFTRQNNLDMIFTLNAGPGSRDLQRNWNPENALSLLKYTKAHDYPVRVWELGNEVNAYRIFHNLFFRINGEQYSKDMQKLKTIVQEEMPDAKTAGPASIFWPSAKNILQLFAIEPLPILGDFLKNGGENVDIVTWHYYPQQSERCSLPTRKASRELLLQPDNLDDIVDKASHVEKLQSEYASHAEIWMGESGNALCGGEPGISDMFVASFWWLDQLGLLAQKGQKVFIRQELAGSVNGLLNSDTLEPQPDYWSALLWKKLMGNKVLMTEPNSNELKIRTYAHCTPANSQFPPGSVSLLVLNLEPVKNIIIAPDVINQNRAKLYQVRTDDLYSKSYILNDIEMALNGDAYFPDLPELPLVDLSEEEINLPPYSFAFMVFPEANLPICQ